MTFFEGAPEEFDQTIFAVRKDRTIGPVESIALTFVKEQQRYDLMVAKLLVEKWIAVAIWSSANM